MKKENPSARRSTAKDAATPKSVDDYFAGIPEPARTTLQELRETIRSVMPKAAAETLSYGIPAFQYKGQVVWLAAFSKHCSFFPTASVIKAFQSELKGYKTSKGTIQFTVEKPLPSSLVKKMVKMRLAEMAQKKRQ